MIDYEALILDQQEIESHPDMEPYHDDSEFCPECGDWIEHPAGPCPERTTPWDTA